MAKIARNLCQSAHLLGGCVSRCCARFFQTHRDDRIIGYFMSGNVRIAPGTKGRRLRNGLSSARRRCGFEFWRLKMPFNVFQELQIGTRKQRFNLRKLCIHPLFDLVNPMLMGGDLYSGFIFVIAPTKQVVGAHDGLQIWQQIFQRHKGR